MNVYFHLRNQFVEILLRLQSIKTESGRQHVIQDLPFALSSMITYSSAAKIHVGNMVDRCAATPGGIRTLLEIIATYESQTRSFSKAMQAGILLALVAIVLEEEGDSQLDRIMAANLPSPEKGWRTPGDLAERLKSLWQAGPEDQGPAITTYLNRLDANMPHLHWEITQLKAWIESYIGSSTTSETWTHWAAPASSPVQPTLGGQKANPTKPRSKESKESNGIYRVILILIVMATFYVVMGQPTDPLLRNSLMVIVLLLAIIGLAQQISNGAALKGAIGRLGRDLLIGIVAGLAVFWITTANLSGQAGPTLSPTPYSTSFIELVLPTVTALPTTTPKVTLPGGIDFGAVQVVLDYQHYLDVHDYIGAYSLLSTYFRNDLCQTNRTCDVETYGNGYSKRVPPVSIPVEEIWDLHYGRSDSQGTRVIFNARKYYSEQNGQQVALTPQRFCVLLVNGVWQIHGITSRLDNPFCD